MWYVVKRIVRIFFYTLGVIFFLLICGGVYVWSTDSFGLRSLVQTLIRDVSEIATEVRDRVEEKATADKHPSLNAVEERALEAVGIDPNKIPAELTPEQEACFAEKFDAARVAEIKAGAVPNTIEMVRAKACLE